MVPTATSTVTAPVPPASPTSTPVVSEAIPVYGDFGVLKAVPIPNPNPLQLYVKLQGPVDGVQVKLYSTNMVCLSGFTSPPHHRAGWVSIPVPPGFFHTLANGAYYLDVRAKRGGRLSDKYAKPTVMMAK
jgi:hypothetical protein